MSDSTGTWRKSSRCANTECIEVRASSGGRVQIMTAGSAPLAISASTAEFAAFVQGCKAGEFDDLTE